MIATLRGAAPSDAQACGRVIYAAFQGIADRHGFPCDFPSASAACGAAEMLLGNPAIHGVVMEQDGELVGCNFADIRSPFAGIGPIAVDPTAQNRNIGRRLMQAAMDLAWSQNVLGIRLVQAAYHNRSLCLYTRLGFRTRAPLSVMQGPALNLRFPGYDVRQAMPSDSAACNALCRNIHGFDRGCQLAGAIASNQAVVVEHLGRITGYATSIGFFGHAAAASNQDMMALIAAAPQFPGPGFLVPTQNHELFAWCLDRGLRLVMQMTLMSIGVYNDPDGAWLPSVLY